MTPLPNSNAFADHLLRMLSGDVALLDAITEVVWDAQKETLLLRVTPPTADAFDSVKALLTDRVREVAEDAPFSFSCMGQVVLDGMRRKNLVLKAWEVKTRKPTPN